ncbi:Forkhead transcription factor [Penicillium ucsense]|uniref:Forkhead transcription factor n=1 Tax=Penicillium ucsense TaxID=2839758 RepID=A0A8J8WHC0_9EURO|nr:Forkhead transcription factor [Penicillium ucsense]KAF7729100.1 Forkhead transcription factor [Penicillium ucsense]
MSSQTMTAPAVGHRPPDPGSDTPMYDFGGSQPNNASTPTDPRSDSAVRDLHNSAPVSHTQSQDVAASPIDIKRDPVDDQDMVGSEAQKTISTQAAAGALLAQLLKNQPATMGSDPAPSLIEPSVETGAADSTHQDPDVQMDDHNDTPEQNPDVTANPPPNPSLSNDGEQTSAAPELPNELNGNKASEDIFTHFDTTSQVDKSTVHPDVDVMHLSNPPMGQTTGVEESPSLLPAFDFNATPKDPLANPQQNDMLSAAYLSQGTDLSAMGYQDGSDSVAGSEPRIKAFAKLEFDDGHFYCNTYSFMLGRDVRAARAAHHREFLYRQAVRRSSRAKSSSGGYHSHTPNRIRQEESVVIPTSVVSDRGGIMGFDPDVPPNISGRTVRRETQIELPSRRTSFSEATAALHANPAHLTSSINYNLLTMNNPRPDPLSVNALTMLPSPDACPTIPIHPPATMDGFAAGHRGISRRHVLIKYNFNRNLFEMHIIGRNGAFIGADWLSPGQVRPLHSGDYIQVGGVRIRFLLPDVAIGETGADRIEEPVAEEDEADRESVDAEHEIDDIDRPNSDSESKEPPSKVTKLILKTKEAESPKALPSVETGGESGQPQRRRGPGRPPKDGIMSKRERAELAREQKMAAKREANGGITPPPPAMPMKTSGKAGKTIKESVTAESPPSSAKPAEKRKYTKRKKGEGMDYPLPSTEGGQFTTEQRPEEYVKPPPVKKRKPSRSPSPNYPPESAYSPEDLAKPPYNYAVLIFDALTEAGNPMTLKQIYRALKLKYPYFRFKCETEGWTSSVRHNLNGNSHLFMHAERDGKGWSWQLRPGASVEKEKKRRPSPPPPQPQTSVPPQQQYMHPMAHPYAPPPSGTPGSLQNQHPHLHSQSLAQPHPHQQHQFQHQHQLQQTQPQSQPQSQLQTQQQQPPPPPRQQQHFQFPSIPASSSFSASSAPPQQQHSSPYTSTTVSSAPPPPSPHLPQPHPAPPASAAAPPSDALATAPAPTAPSVPTPSPPTAPTPTTARAVPTTAPAAVTTSGPVPAPVSAVQPAPVPASASTTAPVVASTPTAAPISSSAPPPTAAVPPPMPAPVPAPVPVPASFPIPSALRGNLPAAFARTTPRAYTSPYASNPAPQAPQQQKVPPQSALPRAPSQSSPGMSGQQLPQQPQPQQQQQQQQQQSQHRSPYPPTPKSQHTPQPPHNSHPQAYPPPNMPQYQTPHPPGQMQHPPNRQHLQHSHPPSPAHQHVPAQHHQPHQTHHHHPPPPPPPPGPLNHHHHQPLPQHQSQHHAVSGGLPPPAQPDSPSFAERANKAIDDFENVLMEDYEDKNYIREVLRSARARVLGNATESSFPGGEPKDEAVIMNVLRDLVGSLKEQGRD